MNENENFFAFSWFDEEQWNILKERYPEGLDDTYEIWRKSATNAFNELVANGQIVKKVSIKVSELEKWCKENNKKPNGNSRAEYASYVLNKKNTQP